MVVGVAVVVVADADCGGGDGHLYVAVVLVIVVKFYLVRTWHQVKVWEMINVPPGALWLTTPGTLAYCAPGIVQSMIPRAMTATLGCQTSLGVAYGM